MMSMYSKYYSSVFTLANKLTIPSDIPQRIPNPRYNKNQGDPDEIINPYFEVASSLVSGLKALLCDKLLRGCGLTWDLLPDGSITVDGFRDKQFSDTLDVSFLDVLEFIEKTIAALSGQ